MTETEQHKDQLIAELQQRITDLEATEQQYFSLFEHAGDAIYIVDLVTLKIITANSSASRRLGYTYDELLTLTLDDIEVLPESDDMSMLPGWESSGSGARTFECHYRRKDGSLMPVEVNNRALLVNGQQILQNIVRDITKRKQVEVALHESNERLSILHQIDTTLARRLDVEYVITQALDAAMRLSYADTGVIGIVEGNEIRLVHALGHYTLEIGTTLPKDHSSIARVVRQQQPELVLEVSADPDYASFSPSTQAQMTFPLMSSQHLIGILSLETEDPKRFDNGIFGFIQLLAARVAVAIDKANAYEEQKRLIEELDAFAHTVAHDLKNPLTGILGYAAMLMDDLVELPVEAIPDYLKKITSIGQKMNNIIDELLLLASVHRLDEIETSSLDMNHIVQEVLNRLSLMIDENQVKIILPNVWPQVSGYAGWVEEVWANYISNAIKYGGIPPVIELGATPQLDGSVRFWVKDNGRGLTAEQQGRLFNQFIRLDETRAQGHGLGLSIVRRIVNKLGGRVGVESEIGVGSIFSFTLPALK